MATRQAAPRLARVEGHGRCEVIEYQGQGQFLVRTPTGSIVSVRRGRMRFIQRKRKK